MNNVEGDAHGLFDFPMMTMLSISANSFVAMLSLSGDKRRALTCTGKPVVI